MIEIVEWKSNIGHQTAVVTFGDGTTYGDFWHEYSDNEVKGGLAVGFSNNEIRHLDEVDILLRFNNLNALDSFIEQLQIMRESYIKEDYHATDK